MEKLFLILASRTVVSNLVGLVAAVLLIFGIYLPGTEAQIIEGILAVTTFAAPIASSYFRVNPKSTFKK